LAALAVPAVAPTMLAKACNAAAPAISFEREASRNRCIENFILINPLINL
jgi:hypothetical protein